MDDQVKEWSFPEGNSLVGLYGRYTEENINLLGWITFDAQTESLSCTNAIEPYVKSDPIINPQPDG